MDIFYSIVLDQSNEKALTLHGFPSSFQTHVLVSLLPFGGQISDEINHLRYQFIVTKKLLKRQPATY